MNVLAIIATAWFILACAGILLIRGGTRQTDAERQQAAFDRFDEEEAGEWQ